MKKSKLYSWGLGCSLSLLTVCTSCDKFFDVNTLDVGLEENVYTSTQEVYAGFIGVVGTFQKAADHYVVASELLGDLIKPTSNAPVEFWDVYRYRATNGNELVSPQPYYNIILNANDFLRHIVSFNKKNPGAIPEIIYRGVTSAVITYRTWAYLTIGKFYGEAVYHDLAISDDTDLAEKPLLALDRLLDELQYFMENGVDGVDAWNQLDAAGWKEIISPNADATLTDWVYVTINPDVLMAEIFLWKGDNVNAAQSALRAISNGVADDGKESTDRYKLSGSFQGTSWKKMFTNDYSSIGNEAYTAVPFSFKDKQQNNLQYYFSNLAPNVYYLAPTNKLYNMYTIKVGTKEYVDSYRRSATITTEDGSRVIRKYHEGKETYERDHYIYTYRAAEVWLMAAEALSNLGELAAADSIVNNGLKICQNASTSSFNAPFDYPLYTWNMRENRGVRGRASAHTNYIRDYVVDSVYVDETELQARQKFVLDSLIANEVGCELAGEGKRWFTLVRMARNNNKPEIVADPVSSGKFSGTERELYRMWLMDPKNWFIKYDQVNE